MKKKYLIVGLFSLLFGFSFSYGLDDGIYHNSSLGLISIVSGGNTIITIQDKNIGATCTDVNLSCSYGDLFSFGNNYHFKLSGSNIIYNGFLSGSFFSSINVDKFWSTGVVLSSNLWGGSSNSGLLMQGPCDNGFYIPTIGIYSGLVDFFINNSLYSSFNNNNIFFIPEIFNKYLLFPYSGIGDDGGIGGYDFSKRDGFGHDGYYLTTTANWIGNDQLSDFESLSVYQFGISSIYNYSLDFYDVRFLESVRCVKNSIVSPDSSWIRLFPESTGLTCDQLLSQGSVQGTLTFYETDSGSYWTITTGGISCRLINWILSGDTVQLYSGTITLYDDYYTYTTSTGLVITTATGLDVNKGTWWNLLSKFSGHNLTVYETDSGFYYTFTNNSGEILTISIDEIFGYTDFDKHYTGISNNTITARRFYGDLSNSGFHWFTCGVDKNTIFSFKLSDYLRVADIIPKLDVNLLGFVSCPFYSLLAGISDNFNNATLIGEYHPILDQVGFYHKTSIYERNRLYTLFDWILIFILFVVFGSIFQFISKHL